jgi:hypothetical protein
MIATILTALQIPEDLPKEQTPKDPVEIQAGFSKMFLLQLESLPC